MVLIIWTAALMSGLTILFLKLTTEIPHGVEGSDGWLDHLALVTVLILSTIIAAIAQMHMLNVAMKYYDQIEVIPIHQTATMVMWILTGLVVFDEVQYYSKYQLWIITGSCCLCFVGVKFLTMKTKMLKAVKKEQE